MTVVVGVVPCAAVGCVPHPAGVVPGKGAVICEVDVVGGVVAGKGAVICGVVNVVCGDTFTDEACSICGNDCTSS